MSKSKRKSARQQRQEQLANRRASTLNRNITIGAVIGIVVIGIVVLGLSRQANARAVAEIVAEEGANRQGPADAPVQIVEFGDFACHSCRVVHRSGVLDRLVERYGDQIAITFRHFPVISQQSPKAAEGAQCASEQGAFWPFHDYMYSVVSDDMVSSGALRAESLVEHAAAIGLDDGAFESCLDSGKYATFVAAETSVARSLGARGTPTFFINERNVSPSYDHMTLVIDEILAGN